jgi:hypothetical protein
LIKYIENHKKKPINTLGNSRKREEEEENKGKEILRKYPSCEGS